MRTAGVSCLCLLSLGSPRPVGAQDQAALGALVVGAGAVVLVSAAMDIGRAPESARLTNARHGLTLTPTFDPANHSVGVRLSVPFGPVHGRQARSRKSPGAALNRSLLSTILPVAVGTVGFEAFRNDWGSLPSALLIAGGLVIGPAVGHWYAEQPGRAAPGIHIRWQSLLFGGLLAFYMLQPAT